MRSCYGRTYATGGIDMVKFPSDEWIKNFKDELNKSEDYEKAAKDWEGDFLFVVSPDEELKNEVVFYVDLWHGKCRRKKKQLLSLKDHIQTGRKSLTKNWILYEVLFEACL